MHVKQNAACLAISECSHGFHSSFSNQNCTNGRVLVSPLENNGGSLDLFGESPFEGNLWKIEKYGFSLAGLAPYRAWTRQDGRLAPAIKLVITTAKMIFWAKVLNCEYEDVPFPGCVWRLREQKREPLSTVGYAADWNVVISIMIGWRKVLWCLKELESQHGNPLCCSVHVRTLLSGSQLTRGFWKSTPLKWKDWLWFIAELSLTVNSIWGVVPPP